MGPQAPDWAIAVGDQTSWRTDQLGRRCWKREHVPERLGSQTPGWAAQENGKETQLWPIVVGVIMLQFCSVSNCLSLTQPFQIKVRGIFFKELCPSSSLCRCVLHASAYEYTTLCKRGEVVGGNFSDSHDLGSPIYMTWHSVLLPDVGSSSRHPLHPDQYYLPLRHFNSGLPCCVQGYLGRWIEA